MPPNKAEELRRKKKKSSQKKLLLILAPVLVILLVVQGPRVMKQLNSAQERTESVQENVSRGYQELAPQGPPAPGAATAPDTAAGADGTPVAAQPLADTDEPAAADEGELISFTRFEARDPFVQLVEDAVEETGGGAAPETTVSPDTSSGETTTAPPADTTTSSGGTTTGSGSTSGSGEEQADQISISVNGTVVVVKVGGTFPADDPAFKLVAIDGSLAKIGLASGSFSNGIETLDLEVGDKVTLISQPDGARFTLKLVKIG